LCGFRELEAEVLAVAANPSDLPFALAKVTAKLVASASAVGHEYLIGLQHNQARHTVSRKWNHLHAVSRKWDHTPDTRSAEKGMVSMESWRYATIRFELRIIAPMALPNPHFKQQQCFPYHPWHCPIRTSNGRNAFRTIYGSTQSALRSLGAQAANNTYYPRLYPTYTLIARSI
jgi:hypothetical protein